MEVNEQPKKTKKQRREEKMAAGIERIEKRMKLLEGKEPPEDLVIGYRFERRDVTGYGGKDEGFVYLIRKDNLELVLPIVLDDYYEVVYDINNGEMTVSEYDYARDYRKKEIYYRWTREFLGYPWYHHYISEIRWEEERFLGVHSDDEALKGFRRLRWKRMLEELEKLKEIDRLF
jgi:hypothetical protein